MPKFFLYNLVNLARLLMPFSLYFTVFDLLLQPPTTNPLQNPERPQHLHNFKWGTTFLNCSFYKAKRSEAVFLFARMTKTFYKGWSTLCVVGFDVELIGNLFTKEHGIKDNKSAQHKDQPVFDLLLQPPKTIKLSPFGFRSLTYLQFPRPLYIAFFSKRNNVKRFFFSICD